MFVCVVILRSRLTSMAMSGRLVNLNGKFYFEKNDSHFFPGAKATTCMWKSFHTFRATTQTFITTYMHQKILSCNMKLDNIGENASKICCRHREDAVWLLD